MRNSGEKSVGKVVYGSQSDASAGRAGLTGEELIPEIGSSPGRLHWEVDLMPPRGQTVLA